MRRALRDKLLLGTFANCAMLRRWLHAGSLAVGFVCVLLFQLQRAPGLFTGLWTDTVSINFEAFSASSLHDLSKRLCFHYKPILDPAMRKWVWFSVWPPTEVGLTMVSWFYAGVTLLMVLFVPWTRFGELKLLAVILLGLSDLEGQHSTEAQGYSFVSMTSWVFLFALGRAFQQLDKGKTETALWIYLGSLALALNSHFFAWPYYLVAAVIFAIYFHLSLPRRESVRIIGILLLATGAVIGLSVCINVYPLYSLLFLTHNKNTGLMIKWGTAWYHLKLWWQQSMLPLPLYFFTGSFGLFHPIRHKRLLGWIAGLAIGPILYVVCLAMVATGASYSVLSRYFLSYLAPVFLFFLLGLESMILWISRIHRTVSRMMLLIITCGLLLFWRDSLKIVPKAARIGWQMLHSTPGNFSKQYLFFEKVKSFRQPTLVLHNQCWLNCVPGLYMNFIGSSFHGVPVEILDTKGCQTPLRTLAERTSDFLREHEKTAIIAIFFKRELFGQSPIPFPCQQSIASLYQQSEDESCWAIYLPKDLEPWLQRFIIAPNSVKPMEPRGSRSANPFVRKKLVPFLFYFLSSVFLLFLGMLKRYRFPKKCAQ